MKENKQKNEKLKDWWKPVVLIVIIVTLFIVMNVYGFGEKIQDLQNWIR
jgi:predicted negative regulator of RcsB-dependent stress response